MPTVLDPVSAGSRVDGEYPLIHLSDPPYTHGLCGTPLKCPGTDGNMDEAFADCAVCIDLNGGLS